jgi:hypothetical protein
MQSALMPEEKKRNTYRLYLSDEDAALMARGSEITELSQSEYMSKLMCAALRCISENNYRMPLPLRFRICEDEPRAGSRVPLSRQVKV